MLIPSATFVPELTSLQFSFQLPNELDTRGPFSKDVIDVDEPVTSGIGGPRLSKSVCLALVSLFRGANYVGYTDGKQSKSRSTGL